MSIFRIKDLLPTYTDFPEIPPRLIDVANFIAQNSDKRIISFGDFDTDGVSSSSVLYYFLNIFGCEVLPYQSRRGDGYGLTHSSVDRLLERSNPGDLVVLMDLGISSYVEAERLLKRNLSVCIIDHHVPKDGAVEGWNRLLNAFPGRLCVYDPLLSNEPLDTPFRHLSAAGLVFVAMLHVLENDLNGLGLKALNANRVEITPGQKGASLDEILGSTTKITAIATQADCMPLVVGGSLTAAWHLVKAYEEKTPLTAGVAVLYELSQCGSRIAWSVSPIINAAGRLSDAYSAFELYTSTDKEKARTKLEEIKTVRSGVRSQTLAAAISTQEALATEKGVAILIGEREKISGGVVGIAAARAAEELGRPVVYLLESDGVYKGSCRSGDTTFSFDVWIRDLHASKILLTGGGHAKAAGISLTDENLLAFIESAEKQTFELEVKEDIKASVDNLFEYQAAIEPFLPYGKGHESPKFFIDCILSSIRPLITKRDGEDVLWAYDLNLEDKESRRPIRIKAMTSDLTDELKEQLDGFKEKRELTATVELFDNYKINSKYSRTEYRVSTRLCKDEVTTSTRIALLSLGGQKESKVTIQIDSISELPKGTFLLRCPSMEELNATLGDSKALELRKEFGGRYSKDHKAYVITHGVLQRLTSKPLWNYHFTSSASEAINALKVELDEVTKSKLDVSPIEIPGLDLNYRTPKPFQYADIKFFSSRSIGVCQNDMGTGKTIISACVAAVKHAETGLPALFVTVKAVQGQFAKELQKMFPRLNVKTLNIDETKPYSTSKNKHLRKTTKEARKSFDKEVMEGVDVLVITYDLASRESWILQRAWSIVVLDECHSLKTHTAHRSVAFFGRDCSRPGTDNSPLPETSILGLSGTLSSNRPGDLFIWTRLLAADGGVYTGGRVDQAKNTFDGRFDGMFWEKMKRRTKDGRVFEFSKQSYGDPENGDEIQKLLAPYSTRREKDEVEGLPPIKVNTHYVPRGDLYNNVIETLRGGSFSDNSISLLDEAGVYQNGQISEDDDEIQTLAGKLSLISSLTKANEIISTIENLGWNDGEPFVIIGLHRAALRIIAKRLGEAGISHYHLVQEHTSDEREKLVSGFQNGEVRAFITSFGIGGVGLNLTRSNRILLAGLAYTSTAMEQARDRVHRIGQVNPVECFVLVQSRSIDERTLQIIKTKGRANAKTYGADRIAKSGRLPGFVEGSMAELAAPEYEGPHKAFFRPKIA